MPCKKNKMKTCDVCKPIQETADTLNRFQLYVIWCCPTALELIAAEQKRQIFVSIPLL